MHLKCSPSRHKAFGLEVKSGELTLVKSGSTFTFAIADVFKHDFRKLSDISPPCIVLDMKSC